MASHTYVVNPGSTGSREVIASKIVDGEHFVDFHDPEGLVLRLRKTDVTLIERKPAPERSPA